MHSSIVGHGCSKYRPGEVLHQPGRRDRIVETPPAVGVGDHEIVVAGRLDHWRARRPSTVGSPPILSWKRCVPCASVQHVVGHLVGRAQRHRDVERERLLEGTTEQRGHADSEGATDDVPAGDVDRALGVARGPSDMVHRQVAGTTSGGAPPSSVRHADAERPAEDVQPATSIGLLAYSWPARARSIAAPTAARLVGSTPTTAGGAAPAARAPSAWAEVRRAERAHLAPSRHAFVGGDAHEGGGQGADHPPPTSRTHRGRR